MTPIATFPTLDEAESALDWIGVDFVDGDGRFTGTLAGDDRELLEAAIDDPDAPAPVRGLARALLGAWEAAGEESHPWTVAFATGG